MTIDPKPDASSCSKSVCRASSPGNFFRTYDFASRAHCTIESSSTSPSVTYPLTIPTNSGMPISVSPRAAGTFSTAARVAVFSKGLALPALIACRRSMSGKLYFSDLICFSSSAFAKECARRLASGRVSQCASIFSASAISFDSLSCSAKRCANTSSCSLGVSIPNDSPSNP